MKIEEVKPQVVASEFLKDGHLSISPKMVAKLRLKKGDKLKLSIEKIFEMSKKKKQRPFSRLSVCGMWEDRDDIKDSKEWVDDIRKQWVQLAKELSIG